MEKPKGKALRYAELILEHYPDVAAARALSNKELAIRAGAKADTAAQAGSRFAKMPSVRAYIASRWAAYYANDDFRQPETTAAPTQASLDLQPECDFAAFREWVAGLDREDPDFKNIVALVVDKLGATTDPMALCEAVMISPRASVKDKLAAAAEINKYTRAKPVAETAKERNMKQIAALSQMQGGFDFGEEENAQNTQNFGIPHFDLSKISVN